MLYRSLKVNQSVTIHTPNGDVVVSMGRYKEGRGTCIGIEAPKEWLILASKEPVKKQIYDVEDDNHGIPSH